jgi:glycolate oxidase FAD binding subunit
LRVEAPASYAEAAALLRESASVRPRGGGTKLAWGAPTAEPEVVLSTERLDRILEHNAGDLTAVLEAGAPLADAQAAFAEAGQMLALDPPLGEGDAATVGGIVATADAGPLRHRYGAVRDLLLGVTVALPDGTVAKAGGKVIKNVAGYDLAKLFAGSFGTLGVILQVVVRLHPLPRATATAVGASDDPAALARAARSLAGAPLELEALDFAWSEGAGRVLARVGGTAAESRVSGLAAALEHEGLDVTTFEDDEPLWQAQRELQRSTRGLVLRVSGLPSQVERVLTVAARLGPAVVGRAGVGTFWLGLPADEPSHLAAAVAELRRQLAPSPCVVLDAPPGPRELLDVWGLDDEPLLRLSRRVKERFDPAGVCNPGVFVGGL